jgi:phosphatidylethanolamine/phosphatidyl-N-methylethanolamine N-methyltransferase
VHSTDLVYHRFAPVYDLLYGGLLQPGRSRALERLALRTGQTILEIGAGSGFGLAGYRRDCRVVAIDLSASMLARARQRLTRAHVPNVALCRMDAAGLAFPDACFDAVYAPYVVNVVQDPAAVGREMLRVCRRGGRLVLLNHFEGIEGSSGAVSRMAGRLATMISAVNWNLDLGQFLLDTGLTPQSIDPVNFAGVSAVVVCIKP